jgi:hypothetical protein
MSAKVFVASRRDLDDAVLGAVEKVVLPLVEDICATSASKSVLSAREATTYLDIAEDTLTQWRKDGVVPHSRLRGRIYYHRDDLLAALREHRVEDAGDG